VTTIGSADNPLIHPVTGERIVFRRRAADTAGELLEMDVFMAPSGFVATPHVHPAQEERFEIRGTEVMFRLGREERRFKPGDVVVVPAGVAHTWWNPSEREAATLVQFRPALDSETLLETWFGLGADGKTDARGMPNPLQLMVLTRHFSREVEPPPPLRWLAIPASYVLAPIGRLLGYRARYERYSGPAPAGRPAAGRHWSR
jgi:quercetin dioxygenase-like cupin family protein